MGDFAANGEASLESSRQAAECNGGGGGGGALAGTVTRFEDCCRVKLALDETCMQEAMRLYEVSLPYMSEMTSIGGICAEDVEKLWWAGVLFVVKQTRENPGFTLTQILSAVNMSIVEFCKDMPQFLLKCGSALKTIFGDDVERRMQVKEVQASLVHLLILFNYFKRVYQNFFVLSENETEDSLQVSMPKRFGWLLFLALRVEVLGAYPDLVTCTLAILAVLAIMIIHMPIPSRTFSVEDSSLFPRRDSGGVNLIASLAQYAEACEEDLLQMFQKTQAVVAQTLPNLSSTSDCSEVEHLNGFSTEGLIFFDGLLDDQTLAANNEILDKSYERAYGNLGDLDERLCLKEDDGYQNLAGASMLLQRGETQVTSLAGIPASPARRIPATPVSVTMTTAKWLRTVIGPLRPEPSPELQEFLKSCDRDLTTEVTYRTKTLLEGIFRTEGLGWRACIQSSDDSWAQNRRSEAQKLYYRVLGSVCRAEAQRLNSRNLSSVLMNEKFHRCMLTCAAELVLATHKTVTMTFPSVLESTGITAFDLTKVIEIYIRHEESLPRDLKRHLNSIEERLLESMAWEKGSAMYNSLIVAKPELADEINRLGLLAEPMPPLDTLRPRSDDRGENQPDPSPASPERETLPLLGQNDQPRLALVSPARERPSAFSAFNPGNPGRRGHYLQSVFASPHRRNPQAGGETCAETTTSMFFQKVLKLAAIRIKIICDRLHLSHELTEATYRVVQTTLLERTQIYFNRHLDQLILCSLYGVCKVMRINLTFKSIIFQYRKLPQAKTYVFRNVFIDQRRGKLGNESSDIIKFYNDHFIPSVKSILVSAVPPKASTNGEAAAEIPPPGSPKPSTSTFPALPDMSPKKVSAQHNVFVSPLRNTKADNFLSPHSRSLYACVGESTHAYQSPSRDLTVINNRLNRRSGRLDFEEASLMSDSDAAVAFSPPPPPPANGSHSQRPPACPSASESPESPPESPSRKRPKLDK